MCGGCVGFCGLAIRRSWDLVNSECVRSGGSAIRRSRGLSNCSKCGLAIRRSRGLSSVAVVSAFVV